MSTALSAKAFGTVEFFESRSRVRLRSACCGAPTAKHVTHETARTLGRRKVRASEVHYISCGECWEPLTSDNGVSETEFFHSSEPDDDGSFTLATISSWYATFCHLHVWEAALRGQELLAKCESFLQLSPPLPPRHDFMLTPSGKIDFQVIDAMDLQAELAGEARNPR